MCAIKISLFSWGFCVLSHLLPSLPPLESDGFRVISYMLVSMHVCPSVHVRAHGYNQGSLSLSLSSGAIIYSLPFGVRVGRKRLHLLCSLEVPTSTQVGR